MIFFSRFTAAGSQPIRRRQQDAAEYAGWLREQFLQHTPWGTIQKGWESRLSAEVVDRGAIYAPILLRCPDQKACHLQDVIYNWHQQAPHTVALTCANPMVCLQIERFPGLTKKRMRS